MTTNGNRGIVTVQTPTGPITLPTEQLRTIVACLNALEAEGIHPTWHVNKCGCCYSVHAADDCHSGYLVGPDGGVDWLDGIGHADT